MTYELAKQLKEAGFKFQPMSQADDKVPELRARMIDFGEYKEYIQYVLSPTLEELIEACGNTDQGTQTTFTLKFDFVARKPCWRAGFTHNDFWGKSEFGSTPTIAVANLWLALHTNKTI